MAIVGNDQTEAADLDHNRSVSEHTSQRKSSRLRHWLLTSTAILFIGTAGTVGCFFWYMHVDPPLYVERFGLPQPEIRDGRTTIRMPNGNLVGLVGSYPDELSAYLRFQYLQGLKELAGSTVLMTMTEGNSGPDYQLYVLLENDLLSQSVWLAGLQRERYITSFEIDSPPSSQIENWRKQTRLFVAAYDKPVRKRLLQLPRSALTTAVAKFILFKVRTDRRVRERIEPAAGKSLSPEDADEFAADMIDVAKFYDIPLDMLLGIGAMENNYLDVRGDLRHTTWKKHASRGDVILKRRRSRVLVSNYSLGPWQITRETLRYVHSLYRSDKRDYSKLPERLRPPKDLDLNEVDTHVLTTYAGLLIRQLLDYFDGDVVKAQGAYNGGPGRPNLHYSEGVSMVSDYAHRVLSMAVVRSSDSVSETILRVARR
ncbi:hypothetical protein BH10ACI4_BH10ACI4_23160 [soil metagenome]